MGMILAHLFKEPALIENEQPTCRAGDAGYVEVQTCDKRLGKLGLEGSSLALHAARLVQSCSIQGRHVQHSCK